MKIFYNDVAGIISEYLTYVDYDKLKQSYPDSKSITTRSIKVMIGSITSRLVEYFRDEYTNFRHHLTQSHGIIAGGFIPKCLQDEPLDTSDIDIFLPLKSNEIHHTRPGGNIITKLELYLEEVFTYKGYEASNRYGSDIHDDDTTKINWIRKYHLGRKHIGDHERIQGMKVVECKDCVTVQVIQVNVTTEELSNFIKNSFDFSVCKSLYWVENDLDRVDITDIEGIMKKKFKFEWSRRLGRTISRYHKYTEKGYDIELGNLDELFEKIRNVYDKYCLTPDGSRIKIYDVIPEHLRDKVSWHKCYRSVDCPAKFCEKGHQHYSLPYNIGMVNSSDDIIVLAGFSSYD